LNRNELKEYLKNNILKIVKWDKNKLVYSEIYSKDKKAKELTYDLSK
jgi:hypothetical protein